MLKRNLNLFLLLKPFLMGCAWRHRLAWLFALISCMSLSACFNRPGDFSMKEKALIENGQHLFPIKRFGYYRVSYHTSMFWFDDERLIFSAENAPGYPVLPTDNTVRTEPPPLPQILLLNIKTGKVENTLYRGYLKCFSAGNIMIETGTGRSPSNEKRSGFHNGDEGIHWYGKFGEALTESATKYFQSSFSGVSCLPNWSRTWQEKK